MGIERDLRPAYLEAMPDHVSPERRSNIMAKVKGKDTKPELVVRKALHRLGYRFRLHRRDLPGRPDLVFAGRKKIVLVHGCFWHGHECRWGGLPKSRLDYWQPKIAENRARDRRNVEQLAALGWDTFVVWQCELKSPDAIDRIAAFLEA